MSESRSPTPIYGFAGHDPVPARTRQRPAEQARQVLDGELAQQLSPIDGPPGPGITRQRPVQGVQPTVDRRRLVPSSTDSDGSNQYRSRSSSVRSLDWDHSNLDLTNNSDPERWTVSTQFNVPLNTLETNVVDLDSSTDDAFEMAEGQNTGSSQNTVRNVNTDPGNEAGGAPHVAEEAPDLIDATLDLYSHKIGGTANAKKAFKIVKKCYVAWEDDFKPLNPTKMIKDRLTLRQEKAEELKEGLSEAILELDELEPEGWTEPIEEAAHNLKKNFVRFIVAADEQLHALEQQPQVDPVAMVKGTRVRNNLDTVIHSLNNLRIEIDAAAGVVPQDDPQYVQHLDNVTTLREKVKSVTKDAASLMSDATDAALATEAALIDKTLREVRTSDNTLSTNLMERKKTFGIVKTALHGQKSSIPVPKFSGSPDDGDYFTFIRDWQRYTAGSVMSENEKHMTLKMSCLSGAAYNATQNFETAEEVLNHLKVVFGNPLYLFNHRIEAIRKLGQCSGHDQKKRDWIVDVKARLVDLEALATTHGLCEKLYNSDIVKEVQNNMAYEALKKLKKRLRKATEEQQKSSEYMWRSLVSFLGEETDDLTFEINFNLERGHGRKDFSNNSNSKNRDVPKKSAQRVFHVENEKEGQRNETSNRNANESSNRNANKAGKKGSKDSAKGNGKVAKGNGKLDQDNYAVTPVNITAKYVEPELVNCETCTGSHRYLYYCMNFQRARGTNRIAVVAKNRACFRCLRNDSKIDMKNRDAWWAKHEPSCVTEWTCTFGKCPNVEKKRQYNFLMCLYHAENNKEFENRFVESLDQKEVTPGLRFFLNYSINQLDTFVTLPPAKNPKIIDDLASPSIFLLQNVEREGEILLLFFDSGCGGAALSNRAARVLDSVNVRKGPTNLSVAGGVTMEIEGGDEAFRLDLIEGGKQATLTGLKMSSITNPFPTWDIAGIWSEVLTEMGKSFPDHPPLPTPPDTIGGAAVDIMVGIRYTRYFPRLLYMLPSGLGVYETCFKAARNQNCVLGGSHPSWARCKESMNFMSPYSFFSSELKAYWQNCVSINHVYSPPPGQIEEVFDDNEDLEGVVEHQGLHDELAHDGLDPWELGNIDGDDPEIDIEALEIPCEHVHCIIHQSESGRWCIPPTWDVTDTIYSLREETSRFLGGELIGSDITYRCLRCRSCVDCKNSEVTEMISLKEEQEQALIESCVVYLPEEKKLVSKLPFIASPKENLLPNRYAVEKIFESQLKRISQSEDIRNDVLASFDKLASRGYFVPLLSLDTRLQDLVNDDKDAGYYIPWRLVWKENSLSTPVRMVFDASARTPGGTSLNEILAKGQNRLASIHNILLRFRNRPSAFACDIRLAYNQISLAEEHYRYQKFLWKPLLDESKPTETYIIRTLIYGVKPVGNSLLAGFDKISAYCKASHPEHAPGAAALDNSAYVDDVAKSDYTTQLSQSTAASLDHVLSLAGMSVKGYTFSGLPPSPELSADGTSIGLIGMAWQSEQDTLSLDIKKLFFGKPKRGKLPDFVEGDIRPALSKNFTRRNLLGKVASVFDPLGLATPITARLKLDLHDLIHLKLGWDERVPDEHLDKWVRNLSDIQQMREIRFRRTIIPSDAVSPEVEIVVSADASQFIAVACCHARVKKKDGSYSSQLISAKSKIVRELTIPKGELRACVLATHLAHTAKFNLGEQFKSSMYVSDSSIALFWIGVDSRPLEVAVRNCVISIRRFSSPSQWYHVDTSSNLADLGTRHAEVTEVNSLSAWQNGAEWMQKERSAMPVKTLEEMKISQEDKKIASQEVKNNNIEGIVLPMLVTKVSERYAASNYLVDPCKYNWMKAVKVMSLIIKYVRICVPAFKVNWAPVSGPDEPATVMFCRNKPALNSYDILYGENYYFQIGTKEVEKFVDKNKRDQLDMEKRNGIFFYTGRILDGQEISTPVDTCFDLPPLHFVKPVLERYSPVSYSIMTHVHTQLTHHRSVAATLRESRSLAHILRGRDLSVEIKDGCRACTRYKSRLTKVEMGKLDVSRLTIAPPFYTVQVDLFGPLPASCQHNHRSVVKVWGAVFRDPSSSALSIHVMGGYSSEDFILAYIRFSSAHGHPARIQIDAGSNLMSACREMTICIADVTRDLYTRWGVGVDFGTVPVGGHNVNGCVERSIKTIQDLFKKVYSGLKLDVLAYESAFSWISSQLNNIPISLGSKSENLDSLDLITPSRLILGRASTRAAGGPVTVQKPSKLIKQLDQVYEAWWRCWEQEKLSDYIPKPAKWKEGADNVAPGDIVLILKSSDEAKLGDHVWRIARVRTVETSSNDGRVRVAICEYRIPGEKDLRTTRRSVRKLAVIYSEDVLDTAQELNAASREANILFFMQQGAK